jgi:hypothetical protein
MSVKRYTPEYWDVKLIENGGGEYVSFTDYSALLAVLRRCVEWMAQDPLLPFTTEASEIYNAAREFTEEEKP